MRPIRNTLPAASLVAALLCACAEATAPLPPAEEVILLVHRSTATLTIMPVESPAGFTPVPLGGTGATPTTVSALGGIAVVPLGADPAVAVVDLRTAQVVLTVPLPANSGATGAAMVDDSIAYVANPNLNSVTRVNYITGDTASVDVGVSPQGVAFTRGKVFVLNGNLGGGGPLGASWISVVDPLTNKLATGVDSILLTGPGNATSSDVAQDGVLYVMSTGPSDGVTDGRLSLVDPVGRDELASFKGFGNAPGALATNGTDRLYISSLSQGLMVFDLINRKVLRGAGNGLPIADNTGVSVDSHGRIYALESGPCAGGVTGRVHILRRSLSEQRAIDVGECPTTAVVTEIPPVP